MHGLKCKLAFTSAKCAVVGVRKAGLMSASKLAC